MSELQISCFICRTPIKGNSAYGLACNCPHGAPVCSGCKSMSGQRTHVGSKVCNHCSMPPYKRTRCLHATPLKCCVCSTSGYIGTLRLELWNMAQAWRSLQENHRLRRKNAFFATMAVDWSIFSSFYYKNFCVTMMVNPWTAEKKKAFFELWLRSQSRFMPYPQRIIQNRCNLWESYPYSPLYISRCFSWRFLQLPWSRLLVCKMSDVPNYKLIIMRLIVRYLTAQHAGICELTF
jgi:hypothetical protein